MTYPAGLSTETAEITLSNPVVTPPFLGAIGTLSLSFQVNFDLQYGIHEIILDPGYNIGDTATCRIYVEGEFSWLFSECKLTQTRIRISPGTTVPAGTKVNVVILGAATPDENGYIIGAEIYQAQEKLFETTFLDSRNYPAL